MTRANRRDFLRQAAVAGAGVALGASGRAFAGPRKKAAGKVLGANNTIRVAVVGINGRGEGRARDERLRAFERLQLPPVASLSVRKARSRPTQAISKVTPPSVGSPRGSAVQRARM